MAKKAAIAVKTQKDIGLDIGYGVTKAITDSQQVLFPSVYGYARELKFQQSEIAAKYPGDQITDEDGSWFVGGLALSQLRTGEQRKLRGRTADESALGHHARIRLMKAAIGKLFPDKRNGEVVSLRIATGLPVDHMRGAAELKESLIGTHRIQTDLTDMVAHITEVMVMPQPYGSIYRAMLTEDGQINRCHNYKTTAVLDIGTYTIDLALDNDGEYVDARSGSVEGGMYLVQEHIADAYERDFNEKPDYGRIESIIRKPRFRVRNEEVNYTAELEAGFEKLRAAALNLTSEKLQAGTDIDVIYLSGGGASSVERAIRAAYPQAQILPDSQIANARGYLNYARFSSED